MARIRTFIARYLPLSKGLTPSRGVARTLMENAQARAGRNPRQAQELRRAASAFLSVVR